MLQQSILQAFDSNDPIAHGLPAAAYIDDEFARLEQRSLFSQHWVFVGFRHEFKQPGDVQPIEVAGLPLFLLCDEENQVRAFHNVCRHRNLKLVEEPGNTGKLIRCPYHSWSYDLCGALKNAPYFGGQQRDLPADFKLQDNGLATIACETWHDWVFVNLAAKPQPIEDYLAPILRQLGDHDVGDYRPVAALDMGLVDCNWKLLMENFIEPYHVQFVHSKTTDQPLENHRTVIDHHCVGSAVELSADQAASAREGTLGVSSHYLTLFPNFVLATYQPDQLGVHLNTPIHPGSTRQKRVIYLHRDATYPESYIDELTKLWRKVHLEDHEMCVRLQQGRHSPQADDGGLLSPAWENSVRRFQELVANEIRPLLS